MTAIVNGVYRNGRIELDEQPENIPDETPVLVTFVNPEGVDLPSHGIDREQAAELRGKFTSFSGEWDSPEMSLYDRYDDAKSRA
ncbi:MAG: hypothetical protein KY468_04240 [Armatimonadetes bacterium]|nr:hypothetical protein [Armatimonadota bacterium]